MNANAHIVAFHHFCHTFDVCFSRRMWFHGLPTLPQNFLLQWNIHSYKILRVYVTSFFSRHSTKISIQQLVCKSDPRFKYHGCGPHYVSFPQVELKPAMLSIPWFKKHKSLYQLNCFSIMEYAPLEERVCYIYTPWLLIVSHCEMIVLK